MQRQEDRAKTTAELQEETEQAASSALATAIRTREMHAETMRELDKQGRQIEKMQDRVDDINYDLKTAEATTTRMSSWFGWLFKKPNPDPRQPNTNKELKKEFARDDKTSNTSSSKPALRSSAATQQTPPKMTAASSIRREDETLEQLSGVISDLHSMALDTNKELIKQNRQLDALNGTTDEANDRIRVVNRNVRSLAK